MYFTPDGRYAIVVAERLHRLDFRDAHTFQLHHSVPVPCSRRRPHGLLRRRTYLIVSCEFSGQLVKVTSRPSGSWACSTCPTAAAACRRTSSSRPDGKVFYVADMHANGLWKVDGAVFG